MTDGELSRAVSKAETISFSLFPTSGLTISLAFSVTKAPPELLTPISSV